MFDIRSMFFAKNAKGLRLPFCSFVFYFSFINTIFYSYPILRRFYLGYGSILLTVAALVFVYLVLSIFYSLIIFKKSYKYVIGTILIFNAIVYHYMLDYGIVFDVNILINVAETNYSEASEFFSLKPFVFVFFFGLIPLYLLVVKINVDFTGYIRKKIIAMLISAALLFLMLFPCYLFESSKKFVKQNERITSYIIPINYIESIFEFIYFKFDTYFMSKDLISISNDATINRKTKNHKKNLLVFMVGESARARNFSLNGYSRATNEPLEPFENDMVSFKNFESCATFTAGSLTCTFSHLPREKFRYGDNLKYESLLDIFDKVGFDIYWKSNNGQCKNVCKRVKNSLVKSLGDNIYDNLLLKIFHRDIKYLEGENNIIFLHGRGSHGPLYFNRYPKEFEKFKPSCNDELPNCTQEEIINAYDNTIYYTSYLIKDIIEKLKEYQDKYNVAFIFMSDHGQSLGEDGIFMHSAPFDTAPIDQKNPAFFMWFSNDFAKEFNIDLNCLRKISNNNFSQDNIFHSMLGLFEINSQYYDGELDIFKICKKERDK